jgi:DNA (cytosine-5)-methyltransferase 1
MTGLIIDNFAGGGGASTGIEAALGRAVDVAINHDEQAIRMHEVNHPGTVHIQNNIWQIDPREVTKGEPVDLAWFSPDCKHFSKAKGGKPREKSIRDLAWVVVLWAKRVRPALILLENVEEFRTWGPLCAEGKPIPERKGETFDHWCRELRKLGYKLEFRELRACDYGAPTIRKRFFMVARCDGKPIVWPEPTHGKPGSPEVLNGQRKEWRTAAEIIDWSIPCPSIFERKKPLAEKTLRRIAHGIMKFVVNNPAPFIVPSRETGAARGRATWAQQPSPAGPSTPVREAGIAASPPPDLIAPHITKFRNGAIGHDVGEPLATVTANSYIKRPGGSAPLGVVEAAIAPIVTYAQQGGANRSVEDPHHTICANSKDQNCIAAAHLVHVGNGERAGQAPRAMDIEKPLGTVVAGGTKHHVAVAQLVAAHVEQANGGPNNANLAGRAASDPLSTVATTGSQQRLVTSNMVKLRNNCTGQPVDEPMHTIATGGHMAEVRAFLVKYYSNEQDGHGLSNPLGTVTVNDRFGLVTVTIAGEDYVIVDIGMRMLTPRELFNAQGFPPDYIIDRDSSGKPITKTAQVAKCGNSVCPPVAKALAGVNMAKAVEQGREAA